MYTVSYNIAKKQSNLQCACQEGSTANAFHNIKMFNFNTKKTSTYDKYCNCDGQLDQPSASVYFTGHPGLVRYMNSGDDSFFTE